MSNPFLRPLDSYERDYDIVGNAKSTLAKAIALDTGDTMAEAIAYVDEKCKSDWAPQSPQLNALTRKPRMDRKKSKGDLLTYLGWVGKNKHIMAPNLICYANPEVEESFLSGFIANNLKTRSAVKKEGFAAGMAAGKAKNDGDMEAFKENEEHALFCNLLQANFKIRNNSISGALSSPYNPLYYASSHTSLTSVCRAITSYANACNEKFLASNRHYFSPEVTIENIAYITRAADLTKVEEAMFLFYISPPSVEHVCKQIFDCAKLYWSNAETEDKIRRMVQNMTDVERAAFSFTGDLNSLHETNDKAMRNLYDSLLRKPRPVTDKEEQDAVLKTAVEDDVALGGFLCSDWMAGKTPRDLNAEERSIWVGYIKQCGDIFHQWKPFIDAFISTDIIPSSIHSLPTIVRRVVAGSDTDSSIFSTQRQVEWYTGKIDFSHRSVCAASITARMVTALIQHTLTIMSGQMAVGEPQLRRLDMKSEIYSKSMINTATTKTYAFTEDAVEGNQKASPELVVKGVVLKSSKLPTAIRSASEDFMWYCLNAPGVEGGISPLEPAAIIASVEHGVLSHLDKGHASFLRTEQIRAKETYANPASGPYFNYQLWNAVFGPKYGFIEQLPADGVKVSVLLPKEKDIAEYAAQLEPTMGRALLEFCHEHGKKYISSITVPADLLQEGCVPPEVLMVMDKRKILSSQMDPFYTTARGLGLDIRNGKLTHLFSDDFTPEQAQTYLPKGYDINI